MKLKRYYMNENFTKKSIILLFIVVAIFIAFLLYSERLNTILKNESIERLVEIAQFNRNIIYSEMQDKQTTLEQIVIFIEDTKDFHSESNMKKLKEICKDNYFKRIGIITLDKNVYITDNVGKEPIEIPTLGDYFEESLKGNSAIYRLRNDSIDNGDTMIFSMPLREDGQVKSVLYVAYDVDILRNLMSLNIFDSKGYSIIIDKKGNKIIASLDAIKMEFDSNNIIYNLNHFSKDNKSASEQLVNALQHDKSGLIKIKTYENMYIYYQPLGINDLYLLTVIPEKVINDKHNLLMDNTYILFTFLFIIVISIIISIIIGEKRKNKELLDMLYVDSLTGTLSYKKFILEANKFLLKDDKNKAFIVLDIDNFKLINDIFGYEIGNIVLKDICSILDKILKGKGLFARRYADNFSIMLDFTTKNKLIEILEEVITKINEITIIERENFMIIPSMGVYIIGDKNDTIPQIQNKAIMASRVVKNKYNIFYNFYYKDIKTTLVKKKKIMDEIYKALENREFYPYYQPKYDAKTQKVIGAEALIRWIKPDKTFISPAEFIPVAEEVGMIVDIDKYMFEAVCTKQSEWKKEHKKILPVSVNISRNKLYRPDFIEEYMAIIEKYGLTTKDIQLEITEGTLLAEGKIGREIVDKLEQLGFDILIDDFGIGYSSISMIKNINATELKIDKSFIDDTSEKGKKIVGHVINFAKTMDLKTVAEGVETKEQYEFLRNNNCDIIQGYYFAKPMPAKEYEKLLEEEK